LYDFWEKRLGEHNEKFIPKAVGRKVVSSEERTHMEKGTNRRRRRRKK